MREKPLVEQVRQRQYQTCRRFSHSTWKHRQSYGLYFMSGILLARAASALYNGRGLCYHGIIIFREEYPVNDAELIKKVNAAMYQQCRGRGYAAPVDVLMDVGILSKKDYENWRYGQVDYLERVCKINLRKLSLVMRQMRVYAKKAGLKPSFCYYKRWGVKKKNGQGRKPVIPLRFSKSGAAEIERSYATHFVDTYRISSLKEARQAEGSSEEGGSIS